MTQAQWVAMMGSNPSDWQGDNLPVDRVSWFYTQEFITQINQKTGKKYALPTEAQWMFAARGGNESKGYFYSGSNISDEVAWTVENSNNKTHEVGTKAPNELGIYDMSGNVWEWCADWDGPYSTEAQTNPTGPSSGSYRRNTSGSCGYPAARSRVGGWNCNPPSDAYATIGFRLVLLP